MEIKNHSIKDEPIQIKWAFSKDQCQKKLIDEKFKKVYISKLSPNVTPDLLRTHFGQFGPVYDIRVIMDKQTQKHKGFGFVLYKDRASLSKALEAGRTQIIEPQNEEVHLLKPKKQICCCQTFLRDELMIQKKQTQIESKINASNNDHHVIQKKSAKKEEGKNSEGFGSYDFDEVDNAKENAKDNNDIDQYCDDDEFDFGDDCDEGIGQNMNQNFLQNQKMEEMSHPRNPKQAKINMPNISLNRNQPKGSCYLPANPNLMNKTFNEDLNSWSRGDPLQQSSYGNNSSVSNNYSQHYPYSSYSYGSYYEEGSYFDDTDENPGNAYYNNIPANYTKQKIDMYEHQQPPPHHPNPKSGPKNPYHGYDYDDYYYNQQHPGQQHPGPQHPGPQHQGPQHPGPQQPFIRQPYDNVSIPDYRHAPMTYNTPPPQQQSPYPSAPNYEQGQHPPPNRSTIYNHGNQTIFLNPIDNYKESSKINQHAQQPQEQYNYGSYSQQEQYYNQEGFSYQNPQQNKNAPYPVQNLNHGQQKQYHQGKYAQQYPPQIR